MKERRNLVREDVDEPAYIWGDGSSMRCRVVNVSAEGAEIDVPKAARLSPRFQLMTENDRIIRNCRIVWTMQNRVGVIFE